MFWFFKKKRKGRPSGLLLISSGGLGDTILLSIIIRRFIRFAEEGELVTLVLPKDSHKLSFLFDKTIKIILIDYKTFRKSRFYVNDIAKKFYTANYRCVISTDFLRHPKLDEMIIKYCDAKEVIAMEARSWPKYDKALSKNSHLYTRLYNSGPAHMDKVLRWSNFANWLNETNLPPPRICLPTDNLKLINPYTRTTVILVPFSAIKEKQSSPEVFRSIITHLGSGYDFIVVAGPKDFDTNNDYLDLLKTPNTTIDTSTFEELVPKLMGADLVVSVDTAIMHLAAGLGVPTVCIASAAYVNEIVPYSPIIMPKNIRFVFKSMDCQGCLGSCHLPTEDQRFPCVARIKLDHILTEINNLISEK